VALDSVPCLVCCRGCPFPPCGAYFLDPSTDGELDRDQADHDLTVPVQGVRGEEAFICGLRCMATKNGSTFNGC
jgi:hypothetical protein